MKPLIYCWILLTIAGGIVLVGGQPNNPSSYAPPSLAKELRRLKGTLEDIQTAIDLPPAWQVETPERNFSISSEPLRQLLVNQGDPTERALNKKKAAAWLDHLAEVLEGAGSASADSRLQEHAKLTQILARPEFAGNAPPTQWDLLQQRILTWIRDILNEIFSFAAQHPSGSQILFWVIASGAVVIIGAWLLRLWTRSNRTLSLTASEAIGRVRSWEEWLRASQTAADRGDPREAIRLAYWAGIVRLQELHALPVNASRTPRENLRLLSEPKPGGAMASPVLQESLSGLTSGLERFWYAKRSAGPDDFHESLRHLEALGCKVD